MAFLCFTYFALEVPEISKFFRFSNRENAGRSKNMRRMKLKIPKSCFKTEN